MKNPTKLLGSYIGIILGIPLSYFSFAGILNLAELGLFKPIALLIPLLPLIFGFLLGWLIHSLILRLLN
jgi:hypothetical protein